jgi:hypothetical protein
VTVRDGIRKEMIRAGKDVPKPKNNPGTKGSKSFWDKELSMQWLEMYENGKTMNEIGKPFGVSRYVVRCALKAARKERSKEYAHQAQPWI